LATQNIVHSSIGYTKHCT